MKQELIKKIMEKRIQNKCRPKCCLVIQGQVMGGRKSSISLEINMIASFVHFGVINRFKKDFLHKSERSEIIFMDLMRFFWISKQHQFDQKTWRSFSIIRMIDQVRTSEAA